MKLSIMKTITSFDLLWNSSLQRGTGARLSLRLFDFVLIGIIPPLLHTICHQLLRCAIALTRQHLITSSVVSLRASLATQNLVGHRVSKLRVVFFLLIFHILFGITVSLEGVLHPLQQCRRSCRGRKAYGIKLAQRKLFKYRNVWLSVSQSKSWNAMRPLQSLLFFKETRWNWNK
jgi:hypothetical protein